MKDPYLILGIDKSATDEEVKAAYHSMARKYHPDNFDDSNPLKDLAAERMQEINAAYEQIKSERAQSGRAGEKERNFNTGSGVYAEIRRSIQSRRFKDAESALSAIPQAERTAEWHYLVSVCLYQRGRVNDAMRELEIACNMDPDNVEYQKAKEMFNQTASGYGSTYYGSAGPSYRVYNTRSNASAACDCCTNLICLDCLCECCGGDLIRCI